MTPAFLDTVGLIALWDVADQWHGLAAPAFVQLLQSGRPLVTTPFVLYECGNAAARRPYRTDVDDLRQLLEADGRLIEPTPADVTVAWGRYRAGYAGDAGIVDQVSFAVMRRLGLTDAFTNDRHFRVAGFTTLF